MKEARKDKQLDVCTEATYKAGSSDMNYMEKPIKQIINNRCCVATVLYGQVQDVSAALLEAHKQNYAGEWLIPDSAGYIDALLINLQNLQQKKEHLHESSVSVHSLLRGMFEWKLKQPCSEVSSVHTPRVNVDISAILYFFYCDHRVLLDT